MIHPDFLPLLSRVLSRSTEHANVNPQYDQLYLGLTRDLPELLDKNNYPDALGVVDDCKSFLEMTETLIQYPEILDRTVCHVCATTTVQSLRFVWRQYPNVEILSLCESGCTIPVPVLLSYGEKPELCAVNYAGCRHSLSFTEFKILVSGCKDTGISLTRMIRMFCLHIPQFVKDKAFLCEHKYTTVDSPLYKYVDYSLFFCQELNPDNDNQPASEIKFPRIYVPKVTPENLPLFKKAYSCLIYGESQFPREISQYRPIYYGIQEKLGAILAPILSFYSRKEAETKDFLRLMENDAVRINMQLDSMDALKDSMTNKRDIYSRGNEAIRSIASKLRNDADQFIQTLQSDAEPERYIPKKVFDSVFTIFFANLSDSSFSCIDAVSKLWSLKYPHTGLVSLYSRMNPSTQNISTSPQKSTLYWTDSAWNPQNLVKRIKATKFPSHWEEAKMMLLTDTENKLTKEQKQVLIQRIPMKHMDCGRLFLTLAETSQGAAREKYLLQAVSMGYKPAMDLHFEECGNTFPALSPLINQLYPEACMQLGDSYAQQVNPTDSENARTFRSAMFYYKLAASTGSLEGINGIVSLLFENRIAPHIQVYGMSNNTEVRNYCNVLIPLCDHLVAHKHNTNKSNIRLGVMLCYKNIRLSDAAKALNGKNNPLAYYCKGFMYENGVHYARNLESAKMQYSLSNIPVAKTALKNVSNLLLKEQKEAEAKKETTYQEDKDYQRSYSSYSHDDGLCFITTAACMALQERDDCEELNLLRSFRDQKLRNSHEGTELVEEYYRVGPMIVEKLNALPDRQKEYLALWENYIRPSCDLIQNNDMDGARDLYVTMTAKLCLRFNIPIDFRGYPELTQRLREKGVL